jgi:hypothetical protein
MYVHVTVSELSPLSLTPEFVPSFPHEAFCLRQILRDSVNGQIYCQAHLSISLKDYAQKVYETRMKGISIRVYWD